MQGADDAPSPLAPQSPSLVRSDALERFHAEPHAATGVGPVGTEHAPSLVTGALLALQVPRLVEEGAPEPTESEEIGRDRLRPGPQA